MTGVTPGAFVIASRWTRPIRPIPITPTLMVGFVSPLTTFICKDDDDDDAACCRRTPNAAAVLAAEEVDDVDTKLVVENAATLLAATNAAATIEGKNFILVM